MEQPDFLVIGHVAKDLTDEGYRPGGTAVYSALTARNLGRSVGVITRVGPDFDLGQILEDVEVICLPSPVTTTFRNIYEEGGRCQYVHAVAEGIGTEDVPLAWREAPIVLLGPIAGEIEGDMIGLFSSSLLGLAPQGWLRRWDEQGRVFPCQWIEAGKFLRRVDVLIVSEEDLAGEGRTLRSHLKDSRVAVVTEGEKGATVYCQGKKCHFPPRRTEVVDSTGAGDVFAAAFLVRLAETDDPHEAARFANVAASVSVERIGIASVPDRTEIEALLVNGL
jgi:sugar/nucleoside kinase (ribokinase family)